MRTETLIHGFWGSKLWECFVGGVDASPLTPPYLSGVLIFEQRPTFRPRFWSLIEQPKIKLVPLIHLTSFTIRWTPFILHLFSCTVEPHALAWKTNLSPEYVRQDNESLDEQRPDRPFHNFRTSQSVDPRTLCCSEKSIDWFEVTKIVKGSVGESRASVAYVLYRSHHNTCVCPCIV